MHRREIRKYLYDVSEACELIARFTSGKKLADYQSDPMLRSAVERQFEIIGEALGQALRLEPTLANSITDCSRIVAFRNRLIHAYADTSAGVVWGILESNLPTLKREVQELLKRAEDEKHK